jgi:hypothetical protein
MCQPKPGPRCSNHQKKAFLAKVTTISSNINNIGDRNTSAQQIALLNEFRSELAELNATPLGQQILKQRIFQQDNQAEIDRLKIQLQKGAQLRKARKTALETGGEPVEPAPLVNNMRATLNAHEDFEWYVRHFNGRGENINRSFIPTKNEKASTPVAKNLTPTEQFEENRLRVLAHFEKQSESANRVLKEMEEDTKVHEAKAVVKTPRKQTRKPLTEAQKVELGYRDHILLRDLTFDEVKNYNPEGTYAENAAKIRAERYAKMPQKYKDAYGHKIDKMTVAHEKRERAFKGSMQAPLKATTTGRVQSEDERAEVAERLEELSALTRGFTPENVKASRAFKQDIVSLKGLSYDQISKHNPEAPYWQNAKALREARLNGLTQEEREIHGPLLSRAISDLEKSEKQKPYMQKALRKPKSDARKKIDSFFNKLPKIVEDK